jgi:hypothetical protein
MLLCRTQADGPLSLCDVALVTRVLTRHLCVCLRAAGPTTPCARATLRHAHAPAAAPAAPSDAAAATFVAMAAGFLHEPVFAPGDIVRAADGPAAAAAAAQHAQQYGSGAPLRSDEIGVVSSVGVNGGAATVMISRLLLDVQEWWYDRDALERATRLEPNRAAAPVAIGGGLTPPAAAAAGTAFASAAAAAWAAAGIAAPAAALPPAPPALSRGQLVRLAPGATRIRSDGHDRHEGEQGEDDDDDAEDDASAWLRPGELGIVTRARGAREEVQARRVGDARRGEYAPGALAPADDSASGGGAALAAHSAPLRAGERVVLRPGYRGPLPSRETGGRLEHVHVGIVLEPPTTGGRLLVASHSGRARSYRAAALERAPPPRLPRAAAAAAASTSMPSPPCISCVVSSAVHGHPVGARVAPWPMMARYANAACDVCGDAAPRDASARCTLGCGVDICASCLEDELRSQPRHAAMRSASPVCDDDDEPQQRTAEALIAAAADAGRLVDLQASTLLATRPHLRPEPSGGVAAAALQALHAHALAPLSAVTAWPNMLTWREMRWEWRCDVCAQRREGPDGRHRCTVGCDWDACDECAARVLRGHAAGAAAPAAVPAAAPAAAAPTAAPAAAPAPAPSADTWTFIDGHGACVAADAPARAVAALRRRVVACALHGAAAPEDGDGDGAAAWRDADAITGATAGNDDDVDDASASELESENDDEGYDDDDSDGEGTLSSPLRLVVRRDAVVASSAEALGAIGGDAWKRPLHVCFVATEGARPEEGVDGGGLSREWYSITARALMELPVIIPTDNDAREFYFNPAASSPSDIAHCAFLGAFLARALLDGSAPSRLARLRHVTLGGVRLCDAFYAVLLGQPLTLADVASVSRHAHASLRYIATHDITPELCLGCFEHAIYAPGATSPSLVLPLRPGGRAIPVTNANKREFVLLKAQSILYASVARQLDAACAGFHALVPPAALRASGITPRQLRRLLCGEGDGFDVRQLAAAAAYTRPYSAAHTIVTWLWEVLAEEGPAVQSDFLEFCTGASAAPPGGFAALRGDEPPLVVARAPLRDGDDASVARLPTAHTCSNTLDLPPYESKAQLREKLLLALAHKNVYAFG